MHDLHDSDYDHQLISIVEEEFQATETIDREETN